MFNSIERRKQLILNQPKIKFKSLKLLFSLGPTSAIDISHIDQLELLLQIQLNEYSCVYTNEKVNVVLHVVVVVDVVAVVVVVVLVVVVIVVALVVVEVAVVVVVLAVVEVVAVVPINTVYLIIHRFLYNNHVESSQKRRKV